MAAGAGALALTLAVGGGAQAGGWGVLTIKNMPDYVTAGQRFDLTFTLRGHGRTLSSGLDASVVATRDDRRVHAVAVPAGDPGHYTMALVLPEPGEWLLTFQTSYGERQALRLPLRAVAAGAAPPVLSTAQRGHRLFLAKGCATCHAIEGVVSNHPAPVGPPLASGRYDPAYIARVLRDPAAAATRPAGSSPWTMPNLELAAGEIEALVAFLTIRGDAARTSAAVR
jgi:mono/diheme cytochrome c family protein